MCAALVAALACALGLVVPPGARAEGRRARLETLDGINGRWEGADCTLRIPIRFKKKKPEGGWYESQPYFAGEAGKVERLTFRLKLRDLRPLGSQIAAQHLIAGTRFRCDGFRFRDDEGYDNAYLALRALPGEVEGELLLWAGGSHPELKQIEAIEQYLRLSIFDVRGRQESLQRVAAAPATGPAAALRGSGGAGPATSGAGGSTTGGGGGLAPSGGGASTGGGAAASPTGQPAADASGSAVYKPRLQILAVAVNPPQVSPGGQIDLVVHYSVDGLPPGAAFEVTETRRLQREQATLAETNEPVARANGSYTSTQKAPVPAGAIPGVYRLEVSLRMAGVEASGAALFEVH